MEYKISVIIPAYKSEATLPETLNCLLGQSLHNEVQIIAVNDGSPDGTLSVIEDYAAKHGNIVAVNKENGGVSSARNLGLDYAEGKYVLFLDADDIDSPETCEKLCEKMDRMQADCAVFRLCRFGFGGSEYNPRVDEIAREDTLSCYDKRLLWSFLVGNKCYRTALLKESGVRFPATKYAEDAAFFMSFLMKTQAKVTGVYDAVHKYRRTDPAVYRSVTQTMRIDLCEDFFRSTQLVLDAVKESFENKDCSCPDKDDYLQEIYLKTCHTVLNEFYRRLWSADDKVMKLLETKYNEYYSMLTDENKARLRQLDPDLGKPDFSKKSISEKPFISIRVKNPSEEFLRSAYQQTLPRFELLTADAGRFSGMENVNSGKSKSRFTVRFTGKKAVGPGVFRAILMLKKNRILGILPAFIIKHGAFAYLKIKDMKNR